MLCRVCALGAWLLRRRSVVGACCLLPSSPAGRRALLCFPLQARGPGQQSAVSAGYLPLSNPPATTGCLVPPCRPEAGLGATAGAAGLLLAGLRGFQINGERRRQLYVLCAMCSCFAGLMPNAMIAVLLVLELGGWPGGCARLWVGRQEFSRAACSRASTSKCLLEHRAAKWRGHMPAWPSPLAAAQMSQGFTLQMCCTPAPVS